MLHFESDSVSSASANGITATRKVNTEDPSKNEAWQTNATLGEKESFNPDSVDELVSSLSSVNFTAVLGQEKKAEYGLDEEQVNIEIAYEGKKRQYQIAKFTNEDRYVLKASDRPEYFEISSFAGKNIIDNSQKDAWIVKEEEEEAQEAEETDN